MQIPEQVDYREIFENFVDEVYVEMLDEEGLEAAVEYSEKGGGPYACVAVGIYESGNYDWSLEAIAEELEVSRRTLYNARKALELDIRERNY